MTPINDKIEKIPEEFGEVVSNQILSDNYNKNMQNGIFKLDLANVRSAVVYGVVAVAVVVISEGTVFGLDWKVLTDVGVIAVLTSLVKNLLTTDSGQFVGVVGVK